MTTKKILTPISLSFLLALMVTVFSVTVNARQIADVTLPDKLTIDGTKVALQLNGMGYRTKFIFDVYILGFYTEAKVDTRDAAQALTGPKRIVMHMVRDVNREKMANALKEGFEANTSATQMSKLNTRIQTFASYFPDLNEGDVIILDYVPASGTRVTINNKVKGIIEGVDFYTGLLDIWLGSDPADEDLKDAMLGQETED